MRKAMFRVVSKTIQQDQRAMLLLIDIGAWAFKKMMQQYPTQIKNIGIFEPGTVGVAAGLAIGGLIPTVYGISPFIAQRSLEQLKLDFVYQKVGGNFITTGASYDFSTLGYSHYCAEDYATLRLLPGMEILAPATPDQFEQLYASCWDNGKPTYFRMTDHCNKNQIDIEFGKACILKHGAKGTVIAVAEMLDAALEACANLDVTLLYYTTLAPFDYTALKNCFYGNRVFVISPFYEGSLTADIMFALQSEYVRIGEAGVPLEVLRTYGTKHQKDVRLGLTANDIHNKLVSFLSE